MARTAEAIGRALARVALAGFLLVPSAVLGQISPGELAQPHAELEGVKNCLKCHKLGAGPSVEKCLECHQEIAVRMKAKKGYHHVAVNRDGSPCFSCHSDHAGRDFKLVTWPGGNRDDFDHTTTGWDLDGAHTKTKCRDCHKPDLIRDDLRQFRESVNLNTTFLGLHETCISCHHDEHRGQTKDECEKCHTTVAFKPIEDFDHSKTRYALTGRHAKVECAKCHHAERDPKPWDKDNKFTRYRPLAFENCTPCHKDAHAGRFGEDCAKCHNTGDWRDIAKENFDHSRTRYPLEGLHAKVACEKCHTSGIKKGEQMRFAACTDCHRDEHNGQFVSRRDGGRCESCHDVFGFKPSHYTTADHAKTRFPLEGAHLAQACIACHKPVESKKGAEYVRYRLDDTRCKSCHEDVHMGQLEPKACQSCHIVDDWRHLVFDHDRDSSYRLEGEHRRVKCGGCHMKVTEKGKSFIRYKPIDHSCRTCHTQEGLQLKGGGS